MALTGDFSQEKARVTDEMRLRLSALRTDKMLPPILKEVAIKIGVVSVFRCSAGLVPWPKAELDHISKSWVAAYKQAWTFSKTLVFEYSRQPTDVLRCGRRREGVSVCRGGRLQGRSGSALCLRCGSNASASQGRYQDRLCQRSVWTMAAMP
jgi:hypothetical protein